MKKLGIAIAMLLLLIVGVMRLSSEEKFPFNNSSDQTLSFAEKVESLQYDYHLYNICPFYNSRLKEFDHQTEQLRKLKRLLRSETLGNIDPKSYRELLRREDGIAELKWRLGYAHEYNERVSEYFQAGWNRKHFQAANLPVKVIPYEWCST